MFLIQHRYFPHMHANISNHLMTHQKESASDLWSSLSLQFPSLCSSGLGLPTPHIFYSTQKFHQVLFGMIWEISPGRNWQGPHHSPSFMAYCSVLPEVSLAGRKSPVSGFCYCCFVLSRTETKFCIFKFCVIVKYYPIIIQEDSCIIASVLGNREYD